MTETQLEQLVRKFCKLGCITLTSKEPCDGSKDYWLTGKHRNIQCQYTKHEKSDPKTEIASFRKGSKSKIILSGLVQPNEQSYLIKLMLESQYYNEGLTRLKPIKSKKDSPEELSNALLSELNKKPAPKLPADTAYIYAVAEVYSQDMEEIKNMVCNQMGFKYKK